MSSIIVAVFFIISVCKWNKRRKITRVQPIHRGENNQPSIENMAPMQNVELSQRIRKIEESKEEEKIKRSEDDLKQQSIDDSLNIDDIFPQKDKP